jgi:hypothetical protein
MDDLMSTTLDADDDAIQTTGEWPEGLDFALPRRDLGRGQYVLSFLIALLLAIVYWLVADPILRVVRNGVTPGGVIWLAIWGFLAYQLCRRPLWFCLGLWLGRREIGLRPDWLYAGERVGWLRRTKRWPLTRLKRLQVVELLAVTRPADSPAARELVSSATQKLSVTPQLLAAANRASESGSTLVGNLHVLTGVLDDGQRIVLAPVYPKELLERLAQKLSQQIALVPRSSAEPQSDAEIESTDGTEPALVPAPGVSNVVEAAAPVSVLQIMAEAQEKMRKAIEPDVFEQPPDSDVQVEQFPDGVTFRIPPAGVWKGSAGLFAFGLLFAVVTGGFTILFAGVGIAQGHGAGSVMGAIGIMSIFWLASGGMLYGGWVMGMRETAVAVVGDKVMVMQTGPRRAKRREWPRSEVKTARVGPSGTEINDKPVLELQFLGADDKKLFGMLMGRDVQELHWMATLLRRALKPSAPLTESSPPEQSHTEQSLTEQSPTEQSPMEPPQPADAQLPTLELDFSGMTIEERLQVARLTEDFSAAVERNDREAMLQILERVELPAAGAAAYADDVLADPRKHGF